jgi:hypothetical protein
MALPLQRMQEGPRWYPLPWSERVPRSRTGRSRSVTGGDHCGGGIPGLDRSHSCAGRRPLTRHVGPGSVGGVTGSGGVAEVTQPRSVRERVRPAGEEWVPRPIARQPETESQTSFCRSPVPSGAVVRRLKPRSSRCCAESHARGICQPVLTVTYRNRGLYAVG